MRAISFLLVLLGSFGACHADGVVFIVNQNVPASALSRQDVGNILLGKKTKWDGGGGVKLALLESQHAEFLAGVIGKSPEQTANYWKRLVFTGQGIMPRIFKDETELLRYVAETPGACGYATPGKAPAETREIPVH